MQKRIIFPAHVKILRDGKIIMDENVICKCKSPYELLVFNEFLFDRGLHLHINGLQKGVITNEHKRHKKEEHIPLTAENFDKLKKQENGGDRENEA